MCTWNYVYLEFYVCPLVFKPVVNTAGTGYILIVCTCVSNVILQTIKIKKKRNKNLIQKINKIKY